MRRLFVTATLLAISLPALAASAYKITIVGEWDHINAMNNLGIGVGSTDGCCVYTAQTYSAAGTARLPLPASLYSSQAWGINDHGTVVGEATAAARAEQQAFVYANGVYRDLGGLTSAVSSHARDVNNAGTVLVQYIAPDSSWGSYVWSEAGGVRDIGNLNSANDYTWGQAINDRGQVAGQSRGLDGYIHAFRWTDGTMQDLGALPSGKEVGSGINGISEQGEVFGSYYFGSDTTSFVIRDSGTEYFPSLGKIVYIDKQGRIYGKDETGHPVYVENGVVTYIADMIIGGYEWSIGMNAVNESGQILGIACRASDCNYSVLLSPVPEPATYGMLLLGSAMLYGFGRRRPV